VGAGVAGARAPHRASGSGAAGTQWDVARLDVRDAADIPGTGTVPAAVNVSGGTLTYKADHEISAR
jgi:hypothetical protein